MKKEKKYTWSELFEIFMSNPDIYTANEFLSLLRQGKVKNDFAKTLKEGATK